MWNAVFGAITIGFAPILVRLIDLGPAALGFYRCGLAAICLFTVAIIRRKRLALGSRHAQIWAFAAGLAFAADLFVWHQSVKLVGAGLSTVLGNTQVFYLALVSLLIGEEKLGAKLIAAVSAGFLGVLLIAGAHSGAINPENYHWGVIYGLCTGIFYATYVVALKKVGEAQATRSPAIALAWVSVYTALTLFAVSYMSAESAIVPVNSMQVVYLLLLSFVVHAGGWVLISRGLASLTSAKVGLTLLLQPLTATFAGHLIFGENFSSRQILGISLILFGFYLSRLSGRRR